MDKMKRDWSFRVDLSDIKLRRTKQQVYLPEGIYTCRVVDVTTQNGRANYKFEVIEAEHKGKFFEYGLTVPRGPDDKVRKYWEDFAVGVGITDEQLQSPSFRLSADLFVGKRVAVKYRPANDAMKYPYIKIEPPIFQIPEPRPDAVVLPFAKQPRDLSDVEKAALFERSLGKSGVLPDSPLGSALGAASGPRRLR